MRAIVTPDGRLTFGPKTYRAALGYGGVRADKQEGDGATPAGRLPLRQVLYRPDRLNQPVCRVAIRPLTPGDGWCDDPASAAYNQPVQLPIQTSAETLWRDDLVYDVIGVLGWNDDPVAPGRGSAIFLHVARSDFAPTEGCIALALSSLLRILSAGLTEILVIA